MGDLRWGEMSATSRCSVPGREGGKKEKKMLMLRGKHGTTLMPCLVSDREHQEEAVKTRYLLRLLDQICVCEEPELS